jgi:myosin heavy subunit
MSLQKVELEKTYFDKLEMAKELIRSEEENKMTREEREKIEYNHQIEIEYLKATFETKSKDKSVLIDKKLANLERELDEAKLKIIETESKWESSCESNRQLEQKILDLKSEIKQTAEKYKQRINELKHSLEVKIADYTRQLKEKTEIIEKFEKNLKELNEVKQSLKEESEAQECEIATFKNLITKLNKKVDDLENELVEQTESEANHKNELNQLKNDSSVIRVELEESNEINKNLQLKIKESQEFVLSSSKENVEERPRKATKREAESNKTSKLLRINRVKDNQDKASTISTVKDNEIINTEIPNEPSKRVTRSTAKKITILESLNQQPKKLQNINEFEEQNELEAAATAKPKKPRGKK